MNVGAARPVWGVFLACFLSFLTIRAGLRAQPAPQSVALPHVAARLAAHQLLRIVAFGSSSTQGIGASSPATSYPSQLQADLMRDLQAREAIIVLNRGIGGEDADDMTRRLAGVIAEHPDLIIWQTGSNDPLRGVPLDRFVKETLAGIQQIRAAGIDVMLMEPQFCRRLGEKSNADTYREALQAIGDEMHVPVIRRYEMMQEWLAKHVLAPAQMLSSDGLHMADAGYALLADAVAKDILQRANSQHIAMRDADALRSNASW